MYLTLAVIINEPCGVGDLICTIKKGITRILEIRSSYQKKKHVQEANDLHTYGQFPYITIYSMICRWIDRSMDAYIDMFDDYMVSQKYRLGLTRP